MLHTALTPSFGRRKARKLREHSQKAYEKVLPLLKVDPLNPSFDSSFPDVWLEIGFGGGEHMLAQLAQHPSVAMIGCEPFLNGVAKLCAHLPPQDNHRVRIWQEDVRYLLETLPSSYFGKAFILFPDPWPKKRHHRRRLITKEFMAKLARTLQENALLYIASDDPSYVEQIQDVLSHDPHFVLCEGPSTPDSLTWGERPQGWPATRYEQKALAQGKRCAYMVFQFHLPS